MPQYAYIRFVQIAVITLAKYFLLASRRLTISRSLPEKLDPSTRYVIASNHASYGDPIALWAVFTFMQLKAIAPVKVMTGRGIYFGFLRPFVWSLGAFPAKARDNYDDVFGLEGALHYISAGYNLGIFPEGARSLQSQKKSYPGVSSALAEYPDARLILVHITWNAAPWWRRKIELRATLADASIDRHDASKIVEAIYEV